MPEPRPDSGETRPDESATDHPTGTDESTTQTRPAECSHTWPAAECSCTRPTDEATRADATAAEATCADTTAAEATCADTTAAEATCADTAAAAAAPLGIRCG